LSFLANFGLISSFSDMSIGTPPCFGVPFAQNIFHHPFPLNLFFFASEVHFLQVVNSWVLLFNPPDCIFKMEK
jgi:hypothetical protein